MNQDVQRFIELLKTDESLQEKMSTATKNYTGDQTQEAIFENLILPAAQDAGFSFTEEEYQQYLSNAVQSIDLDEMAQVNGGVGISGVTDKDCWGIATIIPKICIFAGNDSQETPPCPAGISPDIMPR